MGSIIGACSPVPDVGLTLSIPIPSMGASALKSPHAPVMNPPGPFFLSGGERGE
jgi:hypothetical protein